VVNYSVQIKKTPVKNNANGNTVLYRQDRSKDKEVKPAVRHNVRMTWVHGAGIRVPGSGIKLPRAGYSVSNLASISKSGRVLKLVHYFIMEKLV
jgi:hypothetical protein